MKTIYTLINGEFLPSSEASVHISDLGLQRGYGIFDFFKVVGGKPVFLDDHLERFFQSAQHMRLPLEIERSALEDLLYQLLEKNNLQESGVRITLTGGYSVDGYSIAKPNLIISQQALNLSQSLHSAPIRLMSFEHRRQLPEIKTTDYLMAVWLRNKLATVGADEVLYQLNGSVSECPRANIFMVKGTRLITPKDNILKGVIRKKILGLNLAQLNVEEREIQLSELFSADEVFITSTTKNILPVSSIDQQPIGKINPGPVSLLLRKEIENLYL